MKSITVHRIDRFAAGLLRPVVMPDGSTWYEGRAARPGVHVYLDVDGTPIRELVTADTLARTEDLATLAGAPVTLYHPPQPVDPDNFGEYAEGVTASEVETEEAGGFVRVKLKVMRRRGLDAIARGDAQELSCGYVAEIDPTPGEDPEFGAYDRRQISRQYNHLALVPKGRHGPSVRLRADAAVMRLDGAEPWQVERVPATTITDVREDQMLTFAAVLGLLTQHKDDHQAAAKAIVDAIPRGDKSDAEYEKEIRDLKAQLDKVKADMKKMEDRKHEEAKDAAPTLEDRRKAALDRVALEAAAKAAKVDGFESIEDAELRRKVVKARVGDALPEDAGDEVVYAMWAITEQSPTKSAQGWTQASRSDANTAGSTRRVSPLDSVRYDRAHPAK